VANKSTDANEPARYSLVSVSQLRFEYQSKTGARTGTTYIVVVPLSLMRYGLGRAIFKQLNNYSGKPTKFGKAVFYRLYGLPGLEPSMSVNAPTTLSVSVHDVADGTKIDQDEAFDLIKRTINEAVAKHETGWARFVETLRKL
jgi:hypothetical protein